MLIVNICLIGFLFLYVIFFGFYFILPVLGNAPYYPSNKKAIEAMLKLAKLDGDESIVDLGSGDGRLVFETAKRKLCRKATGIEHNPFFVLFCRIRALFSKNRAKISFKYGSFYSHDLSQYDVIFCYLLPETMRKLEPKFKKELKAGTIVVSNTFHIDGFKEIGTIGKIKAYVVK